MLFVLSIKNNEIGGARSTYGKRRKAYRVLVEIPEGRRSLERSRRRWENNIKMDLREVGWIAWTGSMWLRIETGGRLLLMR
jgi:hypothetical protein